MWMLKLWHRAMIEPESIHLRRLVLEARRAGQARHEMIQMVAKEIYFDELARGGSVLDLGIWGPALWFQEAERLVDELLRDDCQEAGKEAHCKVS